MSRPPDVGPRYTPRSDPSGTLTDQQRDASPLAANLVGGRNDRGGRADGDDHRAPLRSGGSYSVFVAWMKVLLPFLALGLIALIVIWPRLKSDDTFHIGFSSVRLSGSAQPGVDNARYMGTDENRRPYTITADLARIDDKIDGLVRLETPKADLTLENGTWLVLTANKGRFFEGRQHLELEGNVNLFHDTGYEIATEHLNIDLKTNVAQSTAPVVGHGPFGVLNSAGLKLIDRGRIIYFTGPAKLVLYPSQNAERSTK